MAWHDEYPHKLYASVLLLNGKIINWKVANRKWSHPFEINMGIDMFYKIDQMKVKSEEYEVNNDVEHSKVFEELAPKWFKQWELSDDYEFMKPMNLVDLTEEEIKNLLEEFEKEQEWP